MLAGLIIFIAPNSPSQLVIGCLVSAMCVMYASACQPFIADSDDLLTMAANFEVFLVLFAALLIRADVSSSENYNEELFGSVIAVVLLSPVVLCVAMILMELITPVYDSWYVITPVYDSWCKRVASARVHASLLVQTRMPRSTGVCRRPASWSPPVVGRTAASCVNAWMDGWLGSQEV